MSNIFTSIQPFNQPKQCSRAKKRDCWYWRPICSSGQRVCQYILCTGKSNGYAALKTTKKKDEPPCKCFVKDKGYPPPNLSEDFTHQAEWLKETRRSSRVNEVE